MSAAATLVGGMVSTRLEGQGFPDEQKSCGPSRYCNSIASPSTTAPWSQPCNTSGHTHMERIQVKSLYERSTYITLLYKSLINAD